MVIKKKNLLVIFLLFAILVIAAFLRFYKIKDYLLFLGDQGRDVLIVKRILIDHKLTLLGPTASVGGFYLGPFYYYLMLLPLWLAKLDPVGPAAMVALFGTATVLLLYFFVKKTLGSKAAVFASLFYAFSPLTVSSSRFSWNPNVLPFFSLIFFYTLHWSRVKKHWWLNFLSGIILGICLQLHYLAIILFPLGLLLLFNKKTKKWLLDILVFFCGFLVMLSPLIIFDLRHNFNNSRAIFEFITRKDGAVAFYPLSIFPLFFEISERMFANFLGLEKGILLRLSVYLSLILLIFKFIKNRKNKFGLGSILLWWLGAGLLLRLYQGAIYDYYYGFLYPIPAIALGTGVYFLFKRKNIFLKIIAVIMTLYFLYSSFIKQPFWAAPNKITEQTERIAESIIEHSQGQAYNFALISQGNSDHAYRYFLEVKNSRPVPLEEKVAEQLFVVCEEAVCEPLGHPLWEIAAFGRAEIAEEWQDKVGIRIFKLVHHPDSLDWIGKPAPKGK